MKKIIYLLLLLSSQCFGNQILDYSNAGSERSRIEYGIGSGTDYPHSMYMEIGGFYSYGEINAAYRWRLYSIGGSLVNSGSGTAMAGSAATNPHIVVQCNPNIVNPAYHLNFDLYNDTDVPRTYKIDVNGDGMPDYSVTVGPHSGYNFDWSSAAGLTAPPVVQVDRFSYDADGSMTKHSVATIPSNSPWWTQDPNSSSAGTSTDSPALSGYGTNSPAPINFPSTSDLAKESTLQLGFQALRSSLEQWGGAIVDAIGALKSSISSLLGGVKTDTAAIASNTAGTKTAVESMNSKIDVLKDNSVTGNNYLLGIKNEVAGQGAAITAKMTDWRTELHIDIGNVREEIAKLESPVDQILNKVESIDASATLMVTDLDEIKGTVVSNLVATMNIETNTSFITNQLQLILNGNSNLVHQETIADQASAYAGQVNTTNSMLSELNSELDAINVPTDFFELTMMPGYTIDVNPMSQGWFRSFAAFVRQLIFWFVCLWVTKALMDYIAEEIKKSELSTQAAAFSNIPGLSWLHHMVAAAIIAAILVALPVLLIGGFMYSDFGSHLRLNPLEHVASMFPPSIAVAIVILDLFVPIAFTFTAVSYVFIARSQMWGIGLAKACLVKFVG